MSPASAPSARADAVMVYDSGADRIILFGGYIRGGAADTWAYDDDTNTWTNMSPASRPSGRWGHALAYDSRANRVILFAGYDGSNALNDTWAYDYANNTWTEMRPAKSPPISAMHAMAYDGRSDRVISFGGLAAIGDSNDTWAYDYANNTWTKLTPILSPSGRRSMGITYDSEAQRIVIFGGVDPNWSYFNETWAYSSVGNTWSNLTTFIAPPARYWPGLAYDSALHRSVLFGGWGGGAEPYNDTWTFSFGFRTWGPLSPAASPPPRRNFQMAYDSQSDRVVMFGGYGPSDTYLNDTWASGGPPPSPKPPSAPQALRAVGGNGSVNLTWTAPASNGGSPVTHYEVYRANGSGILSFLAETGNVLAHTDSSVTNGDTYRYDVAAVNAAGEGPPSPEASATPDGTAPQTNVLLSGTLGSDGWYRSAVNVTLNATDDNSGVASTTYRLDDGLWQSYTGPFVVSGDGNHTIDYHSVDAAGNVEPVHRAAVPIDTKDPATTLAATGTMGANPWYVSDVIVSLSSQDSGSGTMSILYRVSGQDSTWHLYSGPFTLTDGMWKVDYHSIDAAGNVEPANSSVFWIDTVVPATQATLDGVAGANGWYRSGVTVNLDPSDQGSGVASLRVSIDGGPWSSYELPFTLSGQGLHDVQYAATDVAGNQEPVRHLAVPIDSAAPTTSATVDGVAGASGWMRSIATIGLVAADPTSGVRLTSFRLDGGNWQAYSGSFEIQNGEHAIDYYSVDVAGNAEAVKSLAVKIDRDAPTIAAVPGPSVFTTTSVKLEWSAHDNASGIAGYQLSVDAASFQDVGLATHVDLRLGDGVHTVVVRAVDLAGNQANVTVSLRVDTNVFSFSGPLGGAPTLLIILAGVGFTALIMWRRGRKRRVQTP